MRSSSAPNQIVGQSGPVTGAEGEFTNLGQQGGG